MMKIQGSMITNFPDILFNPYASACGHVFCKGCFFSSASVLFQGVKTASSSSKCPVCRESGVYTNAAHMVELNMLVKNRCIQMHRILERDATRGKNGVFEAVRGILMIFRPNMLLGLTLRRVVQ